MKMLPRLVAAAWIIALGAAATVWIQTEDTATAWTIAIVATVIFFVIGVLVGPTDRSRT